MLTRREQVCPVFLCAILCACVAQTSTRPAGTTPSDPLASEPAERIAKRGIMYAHRGDWLRAEQYLQVAVLKGASEEEVVPTLIRVCVAASRLRAAVLYAVDYLNRHEDDARTRYVLAHLYLVLDEPALAERELARVSQADPDRYERLVVAARNELDTSVAGTHEASAGGAP